MLRSGVVVETNVRSRTGLEGYFSFIPTSRNQSSLAATDATFPHVSRSH